MVSLAQGNTLRKSAFSVKIFLKILFPYKFRLRSDDNNPRNTQRTRQKIYLKIIFKIFVKISSRKAIHNKSLQQSNVLLRILVKDYSLKILFMEAEW